MVDIFIEGDERIHCRYNGPNHVLEVRPRDRRSDGLTLFGTQEAMRRLHVAIGASLAAAEGLASSWCPPVVGPKAARPAVAEAAADHDDGPAPAVGLANCPSQVP